MAVVRFPGGEDTNAYYDDDADLSREEYRSRSAGRQDSARSGDSSRRRETGDRPRRGWSGRSEEEFIDEQIEAGERSRARFRHVLGLLLRVLAAAACVGIVIFFLQYLSARRVYSTASSQPIFSTTVQDDVSYLALNGSIVYYSRDGASCMTRKGSMVWSLSYEMQEPIVSTAGDILAIADYGGSTIYLQSSSGVLGTVNTNMPIRTLCVSESGRIAAVLYDTDITWIYLFSSDGDTIAYIKTTMSQSGYPLSVALSPDGELLCVSHLITDSTGVSTSVAFYNFGSVGQNYAENNVSGFNYDDEVIPYTLYMNDSVCVAVSDSRIVFYTGSEIPQSSANAMLSQEILGVYADDSHIGLLLADSTGAEDYVLRIYGTDGSVDAEISFSMQYTDIRIANGNVYIHNDTELLMYTTSGQLRYDGAFPESVYQIIPAGSQTNVLYIVTEDAIEKMTLQ